MLELLRTDTLKAKDFAEKYEISTRTVYRYLNDLETAGVPTVTYTGKNGGIGIDRRFKFSTNYLTQEEKDLIKTSISILTFNTENEVVNSIINKLNL